MAITLINQPEGIYPAYNDSFIEFNSNLSGIVKAEIQLFPVERFPKKHTIFGNVQGKFYFNLKDAVTSRLNENGFKDVNVVFPVGFGQNIEGAYLVQGLSIKDSNIDNEDEPEVPLDYQFYRGVKQVGEVIFSNTAQILNHSKNGVDYNLTYFEGFPFSFTLQRISDESEVTVLNRNSSIESLPLTSEEDGAFRLYVDKVSENWTTENFLPLSNEINRIEVKVDDEFKVNLNLKKKEARCGIYLKWFNNDGDYSYFLFDEFFEKNMKFKSLKNVATNPLRNVNQGLVSGVANIGKTGAKEYKIQATVDSNEFEVLESLFSSPSVQMYSSRTPFVIGEFIDVEIKGSLDGLTKKEFNKIELSVLLPESITATL